MTLGIEGESLLTVAQRPLILPQFLVRPASIAVSIHYLRVKSKGPTIRPDRLFIAFPLMIAIPLRFPRVSTTPIQKSTRRTSRLQVLTSPLLALLQVRSASPKMQRLVIGFKRLVKQAEAQESIPSAGVRRSIPRIEPNGFICCC